MADGVARGPGAVLACGPAPREAVVPDGGNSLVVEAVRGGLVESVHRVSLAVMDAEGHLVARAGDPELHTFIRSAAKPFQALPILEDGAAARFGVSEEELALICASHNSEPDQVAIVRGLLERIGGTEDELACGPHRPLAADFTLPNPAPTFPLAAARRGGQGVRASRHEGRKGSAAMAHGRLGSNCSGKHTGMLALARHRGWKTAGYHEPTHPVQRRCRDSLARWAGLAPDALGEGVDGCGVVAFALPLSGLALAYARLAASPEPGPRAVVGAMMAHPELVAGEGRPCTALMRAYPGRVLVKVGAEGVYGAALPQRRLGIGIKVEDGHTWAAVVALWATLAQLDLDPPVAEALPQFAMIPTLNTRGETVGSLRARGEITFV
jgi:L-asparaginase II